jgi:hypothetical protein
VRQVLEADLHLEAVDDQQVVAIEDLGGSTDST